MTALLKKRRVLVCVAALAAATGIAPACRSTIPNRDPSGERFPDVAAESLDGTSWRLPADLSGAPAILLVAYEKDAQLDADRWLLGLAQVDPGVRILELAAVRGWVPRLVAGRIEDGMRGGIPPADWASVVTVYADSGALARLTGTANPRNVRALLLDSEGTVAWFHDRGYSARVLLALLRELERRIE